MRPTNNVEVILKAMIDDNVSELANLRPTNNIEILLKEIATKPKVEVELPPNIDLTDLINDSSASNNTTYSSTKINVELAKKSATSHTHTAETFAVDIEGLSATNLEDALKEILGLIPTGE